jgi:hypothetical protein
MTYVEFEEQHLEALKVRALCISSMVATPSDRDPSPAQQALKDYIDRSFRTGVSREEERQELLEKLRKETQNAWVITKA